MGVSPGQLWEVIDFPCGTFFAYPVARVDFPVAAAQGVFHRGLKVVLTTVGAAIELIVQVFGLLVQAFFGLGGGEHMRSIGGRAQDACQPDGQVFRSDPLAGRSPANFPGVAC